MSDRQIDGLDEIDDTDLSAALGTMSVDNLMKGKTHGYKKRHGAGRPRNLDILLRRAKALELRRAGFTWQDISNRKALGYKDARQAQRDVHRLLQQMIDTPAREVLALELSRLDAITQVLWNAVRQGDLASIRELMQSMRMRQDLLGLTKINIQHQHVTVTDLDNEIHRLTRELEKLDGVSDEGRDVGGTSVSDRDELEEARKAAGLE